MRVQEEIIRQRQEEKMKKLQEIEIKRQQAAILKEQVSNCPFNNVLLCRLFLSPAFSLLFAKDDGRQISNFLSFFYNMTNCVPTVPTELIHSL